MYLKFFVMVILVVLGFSFGEIKAKPKSIKHIWDREFILIDHAKYAPKLFFAQEMAQPRKFYKVISSKQNRLSLQEAKQADITYKTSNAQKNHKNKPTIRVL